MQIADGKRLVDRLAEEGVPVIGACWLKEAEAGQWFLYLITPLVNEKRDTRPAYRRVNAVLDQMPQPFWIDPMEYKVVGPDSAVGKALHDLYRHPRRTSPLRSGSGQLDGVSIEGAYVYPPVSAAV